MKRNLENSSPASDTKAAGLLDDENAVQTEIKIRIVSACRPRVRKGTVDDNKADFFIYMFSFSRVNYKGKVAPWGRQEYVRLGCIQSDLERYRKG